MCTVIRYGLGIDSVYDYSFLLLTVPMSKSSSMQINSKSSQLEFINGQINFFTISQLILLAIA